MNSKSIGAFNLGKWFPGGFAAVTDLSFEVTAGESVAFLGPNGAGKSTTIKMLCGILAPSTGAATIVGHSAGSHQANRHLGLVFGTRSQLFMHMTVIQCLDLVAEIYFLSGSSKRSRIAEMAELLEKRSLYSGESGAPSPTSANRGGSSS